MQEINRLKQRYRGTDMVRESEEVINIEVEDYGVPFVMALINTLVMRAEHQWKVQQ